MNFTWVDTIIFCLSFFLVIGFAFWKSRGKTSSEGFFLGDRSLPWWLIGVSIVAANLSTEQFVGMAGQAAGDIGFAVSSWQLLSSVAVVVIATLFLPKLLPTGIYTMPEYLEYRYNSTSRAIMSVLIVIIYALVTTSAILYSGGTTIETIFGIKLSTAVLIIAGVGVVYVVWGGLRAAVWADLFHGGMLLIGGLFTAYIGIQACGGFSNFIEVNQDKMHLILPVDHGELPWTVLIGGIWIPIFYYCGFNQLIMQRALAAKSLKQAQYGIIFAGALWLLVPVAVVFPGIVAHQLYGDSLARIDQAYPTIIKNLIPEGLRGFIFAALAGAVSSAVAGMLNAGSTIFTMDIWKRYIKKDTNDLNLVLVGRITTVVFLAIACFVALTGLLEGGVFKFIQEFQGYVSPGILAVFLFGFAIRTAPPIAANTALLASAPIYGLLQWQMSDVPYLHRMLITFLAVIAIMTVLTLIKPLRQPKTMPVNIQMDMQRSPLVLIFGLIVVIGVAVFYILFP
ncbi:MAG TPA: sodium/solute symporter [Cytophagaceae bacterium]|jgi:SSS family solute:Na+ symporter